MKIRPWLISFLCVSTISVLQSLPAQQANDPQFHFTVEDESVRSPVAIPADVLDILRNDDNVKNVLESANVAKQSLPMKWFSASSVQLGPSAENDLVVVGMPPVAGGNVAPFWIFRGTRRGHELVLVAFAHDLIVRKSRSKGYRDIELASMSASQLSTVIFRFDGSKYQKHQSKIETIR